jgi:hypothetical protein
MNKIELLKEGIGFVSGIGVSQIVSAIIKNNVDPENHLQQATIYAGQLVIVMVVRDLVREKTDAKIDNLVKQWNEEIRPRLQLAK